MKNIENRSSKKTSEPAEVIDPQFVRGIKTSLKNMNIERFCKRKGIDAPEFDLERPVVFFHHFASSRDSYSEVSSRDGMRTRYSGGGGYSRGPIYQRFIPLKGSDLYLDVEKFEKEVFYKSTSKQKIEILKNIERLCVNHEIFKPLQRHLAALHKSENRGTVNFFNFQFDWAQKEDPESYDESVGKDDLKIIFPDGSEEVLSHDEYVNSLSLRFEDKFRNVEHILKEAEAREESKKVEDAKTALFESGFSQEELNDLDDYEIVQFAKDMLDY